MAGKIRPTHQRMKAAASEAKINTEALWVEPGGFECWGDASVLDPWRRKWAGIGLVVRHQDDTWHGSSYAIGSGLEVWEAETEAVLVAMNLALERKEIHGGTSEDFAWVKFYTDSSEVVRNIESYRLNHGAHSRLGERFYRRLVALEAAGLRFECVRCRSHQDRGLPNDHADALAKEGSDAMRLHWQWSDLPERERCGCGSQDRDYCNWSTERQLFSVNHESGEVFAE
ncbi:uncharacterized protein RCC_08850 [Ramularia collo-cygni]|uniref:Uncharacterized protein n=1 Tax=Ramularia collo-cygni TaxID=112498 RepID=A0A2D3V898_9PEZI|nr:uncharacterized protein RCC_08850 [Ramularia collo-cygni]CZT23140.1 uncharacterized protein RCC_08850 [Ramularia collo-cygni]